MAETIGEIERYKGFSINRVITKTPSESTRVYKIFEGTIPMSDELPSKRAAKRRIDTLVGDL
jgi:hypothetical protein